MNSDDAEDTRLYKVLINHEGQYSIWPDDREHPLGWRDGGKSGSRQECLDYIDQVWTDMRPLSLRKKMEEDARRIAETIRPFTQESHPVVIDWPHASLAEIKDGVDRGFLPIAFTEAADLPAIGIFLDKQESDVSHADFAGGSGTLHLVGTGTIYAVGTVRMVADVELPSRSGRASITILEPATH